MSFLREPLKLQFSMTGAALLCFREDWELGTPEQQGQLNAAD